MALEHVNPNAHLKVGDALPCGCKVIRQQLTAAEARQQVDIALAEILEQEAAVVARFPGDTGFEGLGIAPQMLRELWMKFFVALDIDCTTKKDGSIEYQPTDDNPLPPLPKTIEGFARAVYQANLGTTFWTCDSCWF